TEEPIALLNRERTESNAQKGGHESGFYRVFGIVCLWMLAHPLVDIYISITVTSQSVVPSATEFYSLRRRLPEHAGWQDSSCRCRTRHLGRVSGLAAQCHDGQGWSISVRSGWRTENEDSRRGRWIQPAVRGHIHTNQ